MWNVNTKDGFYINRLKINHESSMGMHQEINMVYRYPYVHVLKWNKGFEKILI